MKSPNNSDEKISLSDSDLGQILGEEISRGGFLKNAAMGLAGAGLLTFTGFFSNSPVDRASKKIILLKTHIAGAYFYDAINSGKKMKRGDKLVLKREPRNPYDINAIEIYWKNIKAGYVPKRHNTVLAPMMDQGVELSARIRDMENEEPDWQTVYFEASMRVGENQMSRAESQRRGGLNSTSAKNVSGQIALAALTHDQWMQFFRAAGEDESRAEDVIELLEEGKTLEQIFSRTDNGSYTLHTESLGKNTWEITFGYYVGPLAGNWTTWNVEYDSNGRLKYIEQTQWFIS
jgi:hypothetical protein